MGFFITVKAEEYLYALMWNELPKYIETEGKGGL